MTCLVARHARHADLSEPPLVHVCRWDQASTPEGDGPPVVDVGAEGGGVAEGRHKCGSCPKMRVVFAHALRFLHFLHSHAFTCITTALQLRSLIAFRCICIFCILRVFASRCIMQYLHFLHFARVTRKMQTRAKCKKCKCNQMQTRAKCRKYRCSLECTRMRSNAMICAICT